MSTAYNFPGLPKRIRRLGELAYNLWWSWHPEAQDLYEFIDPVVWEQSHHNPVLFLQDIPRKKLNATIQRHDYLELYDRVMARFDAYMNAEDRWFQRNRADAQDFQVAYLCAEFAIHGSLPIYSKSDGSHVVL